MKITKKKVYEALLTGVIIGSYSGAIFGSIIAVAIGWTEGLIDGVIIGVSTGTIIALIEGVRNEKSK